MCSDKDSFVLTDYIKSVNKGGDQLIPAPEKVLNLLSTTGESMPDDFHAAVRLLSRPYLKITNEQELKIREMTKDCGDVLLLGGVKVTWGGCDNGSIALMPLSESLEDQKNSFACSIQSSKALVEMYPRKGSMPSNVVEYLFKLREIEVARLSTQVSISVDDLAGLDRGARCSVANALYAKCDEAARHALLHDEHHFVRSCAVIARDELSA